MGSAPAVITGKSLLGCSQHNAIEFKGMFLLQEQCCHDIHLEVDLISVIHRNENYTRDSEKHNYSSMTLNFS